MDNLNSLERLRQLTTNPPRNLRRKIFRELRRNTVNRTNPFLDRFLRILSRHHSLGSERLQPASQRHFRKLSQLLQRQAKISMFRKRKQTRSRKPGSRSNH